LNKKVMLINATDTEEIRVATLVDGVLSDYDIEFVHNEKIKGNIYKAKVVRVDTSLQAAFIHYGGQKNGFLPIGELPRDLVSGDGRRGRIQDLLNKDQEIMVQAVREELGSKGAMMTAQISLPGRYLVLTPGNPLNGISRKIESREEREYFKRLIDELEIPKNFGVIVRTASLGVTKDDFQRDLEYLLDTYKEVQGRYKHRHGAGLVWQEDDVVTRTLRDGFSADMEEVHIDDIETFHAAQNFFKRTMPQHLGVIKHYVGKKPLFSKYQTEEQIDRIYARRVSLPSGGAIVLDQTEALVAVDVNSGKTSGEGVEDMAFKANMEAAEEVARQLRLRDLAGLIVIDFIDMKRESHNKAVMERLVDCLKEDKARMEVGKINRFGVLVMTRQRLRPSLQHVTHEACPTCQGTGQVKSIEALVLSVVRRLKSILSRDGIGEVRIKLAPAIAMSVLNQKRKDLAELEEAHDTHIVILADPEVGYGEMAAEIERREEETEEKPQAPRPERHREPEEETVVLGGDAPISFEKALGQDPKRIQPPAEAEIKYDRRDAQRAALDERERLRALFESAKPKAELAEEVPAEAESEISMAPAASSKGRGRHRGKGAAKPEVQPIPELAVPVEAPTVSIIVAPPVAPSEPEPLKPVFDLSLVGDLSRPAARPKLQATPAALPEVESPVEKAAAVGAKPAKGRVKAAPKKAAPAAEEAPKAVKPAADKSEAPAKPAKPAKTAKPKSKSKS
jgi:ribonuclease E